MTDTLDTRPAVLVAEDEAVSRHAAIEMVEEAGYRALEATNGNDAFTILDSTEGIFAVLTDVEMPAGIDGIRLAACIHQRRPEVGILIVSGKVAPKLGDLPAGARFFAKPYDEAEIVAVLREMAARWQERV